MNNRSDLEFYSVGTYAIGQAQEQIVRSGEKGLELFKFMKAWKYNYILYTENVRYMYYSCFDYAGKAPNKSTNDLSQMF